jgi:hypothetical protein
VIYLAMNVRVAGMIDTIRLRLVPCSWVDFSEIPDGWDIVDGERCSRRHNKNLKRNEFGVDTGRLVNHRDSGLRVGGSSIVPEWVEVSLPRLYHGRNGQLLENDSEVYGALVLLEAKIKDVVSRSATGEYRPFQIFDKVTRLDLCWQFVGSIQTWIQAFRHNKHPNVRRPTVTHDGSGLVFPGVGMHIRIYDKRKEVYRRPGDVVRVECQMRGSKLKEFGLTSFEESFLGGFSRLWAIFKDIILKFNPETLTEIGRIADLLALLEAQGVKIGSQTAFEVWSAGKHRSTVSRMQAMMKESLPRLCGVDLWLLTSAPVVVNLAVES